MKVRDKVRSKVIVSIAMLICDVQGFRSHTKVPMRVTVKVWGASVDWPVLARALGSANTPDPDISATRKVAAKGTLRPLRGAPSSFSGGPDGAVMLKGEVLSAATLTASATPLGLLEEIFELLIYNINMFVRTFPETWWISLLYSSALDTMLKNHLSEERDRGVENYNDC